jgi:predicted metal-dependent peptidase
MKSIKECREYGTLPAFVEKEIAALKVIKRHNWKKDLKVFVNTVLTSKKRLSQKRVNRRLHDAEYILPGKKKSRHPKLLLVRDTSGSMLATCFPLLELALQVKKQNMSTHYSASPCCLYMLPIVI